MEINGCKCKAVSFTKARVKERIRYYFGDQLMAEASSFKYLGIIIKSRLNWADRVSYRLRTAWKALPFITRIIKMGNNNTKRLAYMALARSIIEYGAVCWDRYWSMERCVGTATGVWSGVLGPYREDQLRALNRVQKRAAKFAYNINEAGW
jgi:hypothetical protein